MSNFSFINTKQDLNIFLEAIQEFKSSLFKQANPNLDKYFSQLQKSLVGQYVNGSPQQTEVALLKLEQELKGLPIISLELAYTPTVKQVINLNNWFWENFNKKVLLDISVNPTILAGMVLDSGGKVWDYSLSSRA